MSKGSRQRPIENQDEFSNNWDAIFGKKSKEALTEKENKDANQPTEEL